LRKILARWDSTRAGRGTPLMYLVIEELKEFSDANGYRRMQTDAGGWGRI